MSHLLNPLRTTTRSAAIFFLSRSTQHIASRSKISNCFHYGHCYTIKSQPQHIATSSSHWCRRYSTTLEKTSEPLHILFCGSDDFSCASLKALHDEYIKNPYLIQSIDVVVRPGKPMGRGYKTIHDPPLRSLAEKLNLPIHERDTFTGWDMPPQTNLIIAVSFGLFVPPRLLRAAKYGGLNLHPSLLPDLRGPAPLQHTLLAARPLTGVTLQTLDEHAFDHGVVLAQRPLPVPPSCRTVHALLALVTRPAASMLVAGLRAGLHIPPLRDASWVPPGPGAAAASEPPRPLVHASKITKSDRRVSLAILRACDAEVSDPHPDPLDYSPRVGQQSVFKRRWFHTRDSRGRRRKISMEIMRAAPADDDDGDGDSEVSDPADPVPDPGAHARGGTLARRQDVIGPLWFFSRDRHGRKKRIIIELLHEMPGLSLANRPSMIEESLPANAQPQHASSTPATLQDSTLPYRKYRIPFEDDLEEGDQNPPQAAAGVNLVFWDASHSEPEQTLGQPAQGDGHALCLGNYHVESLKVEGDQARPARAALHSFIIN